MIGLPKTGSFRSKALLAFTRARPCSFCGAPPPSDPHHHPSKGASGAQNDLRVLPVCRACHRRCDGQTVNGLPPIPKEEQVAATLSNIVAFIRESSRVQWEEFTRSVEAARSPIPW